LSAFNTKAQIDINKDVLDEDKRNSNKLTCYPEYVKDIVKYIKQREEKTAAKHGNLKNQQ